MVSPPVGWRVQYYLAGDRAQPFVADVVDSGEHGMVKLIAHSATGGVSRLIRDWVRHADDPHFKENPENLRRSGCWGYVRTLEYDPAPEEIEKEEEYLNRMQEAKQRAAAARRTNKVPV